MHRIASSLAFRGITKARIGVFKDKGAVTIGIWLDTLRSLGFWIRIFKVETVLEGIAVATSVRGL